MHCVHLQWYHFTIQYFQHDSTDFMWCEMFLTICSKNCCTIYLSALGANNQSYDKSGLDWIYTLFYFMLFFCRFGDSIKIVHFIGSAKPWRYTYNTLTGTVSPPSDMGYGNGHQLSFVQAWWNVFMASIKPRIEQQQVGAWNRL